MVTSLRASTVLGPVAVTLLTLLGSTAAHAESAVAPPRCNGTLLPSGSGVPANLPALVFVDGSNNAGRATIADVSVTGGTTPVTLGIVPDPKTPDVMLLVPSTNDLFESSVRYDITYRVSCTALTSAANLSDSFMAGPAVALPTSIGSVTELADGKAVIDPSPELTAFARTTRFEGFVDGVSAGFTSYGRALGPSLPVELTSYGLRVGTASFSVYPKVCATREKETHAVKLVAHVAGTDVDTAPVTMNVTVDCATPQSAPYVPDAGGEDRGASGGGDGGCAVGHSEPLGQLAAVFATGAALAVLARRRRRGV